MNEYINEYVDKMRLRQRDRHTVGKQDKRERERDRQTWRKADKQI